MQGRSRDRGGAGWASGGKSHPISAQTARWRRVCPSVCVWGAGGAGSHSRGCVGQAHVCVCWAGPRVGWAVLAALRTGWPVRACLAGPHPCPCPRRQRPCRAAHCDQPPARKHGSSARSILYRLAQLLSTARTAKQLSYIKMVWCRNLRGAKTATRRRYCIDRLNCVCFIV